MPMKIRAGSESKLVKTMVLKRPMYMTIQGESSVARARRALEAPLTRPKSAELAPRRSTKKRPIYGMSRPVPNPARKTEPVMMTRGLKRSRRRRGQNEDVLFLSVASPCVSVSFLNLLRDACQILRRDERTNGNRCCPDLTCAGRLAVIRKRGRKLERAVSR